MAIEDITMVCLYSAEGEKKFCSGLENNHVLHPEKIYLKMVPAILSNSI